MIAVLIDTPLTEEEFKKFSKKISNGKNIINYLKEKYINIYNVLNDYFDDEKLYSFNDNNYFYKYRIYDENFDTIGYILFNNKTNLEVAKRVKDDYCTKCGNRISTEVPFGELSYKQLEKIKFKENVRACHCCQRVFEIIENQEKTIKQSIVLKLNLKLI